MENEKLKKISRLNVGVILVTIITGTLGTVFKFFGGWWIENIRKKLKRTNDSITKIRIFTRMLEYLGDLLSLYLQ